MLTVFSLSDFSGRFLCSKFLFGIFFRVTQEFRLPIFLPFFLLFILLLFSFSKIEILYIFLISFFFISAHNYITNHRFSFSYRKVSIIYV